MVRNLVHREVPYRRGQYVSRYYTEQVDSRDNFFLPSLSAIVPCRSGGKEYYPTSVPLHREPEVSIYNFRDVPACVVLASRLCRAAKTRGRN